MMVVSTGDIHITTPSIQREEGKPLDEQTIYDIINVQLIHMSVFMTHTNPKWIEQTSGALQIINPFSFNLKYYHSISPSDIRFPSTKVSLFYSIHDLD